MAEFNPVGLPPLSDTGVPDMTSVSRGTGPDRTFESLFSGLTQTLDDFTKAKDTQTQLDIRDEADTMFQKVNSEYGLDVPDGVSGGLDQIQTLQNALQQGKISEVNYYGRLATLSKQLRSKYPGYDQVVDATIQSVTGTRPANAYRDAIFSAIAKAGSDASDTEKFQRNYEKTYGGQIALLFPDYFDNPGKYDFQEVQSAVSKFQAKSAGIKAQKEELSLMSSRNSFNVTRAKNVMDQDFAMITQSAMSNAVNANDPSFEQRLNQIAAAGGGSKQDIESFIGSITQAETELRATLTARGRKEFLSLGMSMDDVNKAVDAALYPLLQAKEAVLGGDFKLAGKYATLNQAVEDKQLSDLLSDPNVRIGSGLSKINNTFGSLWLDEHREEIFGRIQSGKSNLAGSEISGQILNGRPELMNKTVQKGDSDLTKATLNTSFSALVDPNATPDAVSNMVKSLFGSAAPNWLDRREKVVDPEDFEALYTKFLDPRVTKAIYEKGTDQDKEAYYDWAISNLKSIPAFLGAAGDVNSLNSALKNWHSDIQIGFNPKTMRVEARVPSSANPREAARVWKPYGRTVNALNKVFQVLGPLADAEGIDRQQMAADVLKSLSVNLDGITPASGGKPVGKAPESFFDFLYRAVTAPEEVLKEQEKLNSLPKSPDERDTVLPETQQASDGIDFLETEDYDPENIQADVHPTPRPESPSGGLGSLIVSNKRGYVPDIDNLNDNVRTGVIELQSAWGRPLPVISGFRDAARNAKAGGARHSQHIHGNAVDIDVSDLSIDERKKLIRLARQNGFGGIGVYRNSLHIDRGPTRAWGPSYHKESLPAWALDAL